MATFVQRRPVTQTPYRLQFPGTFIRNAVRTNGTFFYEDETLYFFPDRVQPMGRSLAAGASLSVLSGLILYWTNELAQTIDGQSYVVTADVVLTMIFIPLLLFGVGLAASTFREWRQARRALRLLAESEEFLGTPLSDRAALDVDSFTIAKQDVVQCSGTKTIRVKTIDDSEFYIRPKSKDPQIVQTILRDFSTHLTPESEKNSKTVQHKTMYKTTFS